MAMQWVRRVVLAGLMVALPAMGGERVMLNEASVEQFAALEGLDVAEASAIVALRSSRGGKLNSVEELRILPGLSEGALDALRGGTSIAIDLPAFGDKTFENAADVLASFDGEPDVGVVHHWTSEYARVRPESVDKWLRASRAFAALPQFRVEYRLKDDWQNDFRYYDDNGQPPVTDFPESTPVKTDSDVGQDRTLLLRATWDLDKLVMSSEQIRVINEAQDVVKLREKVLGEVTRLYFERRRLQVDMLLNPKSDLLGQVKDELRLRELTANVDALTGGRFSAGLSGD